jgi:predicted DCC family thiol-disulfide oxidoreductase YuxK
MARAYITDMDKYSDTLVYLRKGVFMQRSTAILYVARDMGGIWSLLFVFIIVPAAWRDALYRWVAVRRYRWWGKRAYCMVPAKAVADRFLD